MLQIAKIWATNTSFEKRFRHRPIKSVAHILLSHPQIMHLSLDYSLCPTGTIIQCKGDNWNARIRTNYEAILLLYIFTKRAIKLQQKCYHRYYAFKYLITKTLDASTAGHFYKMIAD